MAGQSNAAPVIIKRKKNVIGGGHHGGAWKVAYADFVTAMMAFFLLMWLLNATTEKQRKGLADYFSPTIPVTRVSGGGDGSFGGDSIVSEMTLVQNGTGASAREPAEENRARGAIPADAAAAKAEEELMAEVEKALLAKTGESMTMERLLRHVITRVTDEGLVIEIYDLPGQPLFTAETAEPTGTLTELAGILAEVLAATTNSLAVSGHTKSYPVILRSNPVWSLSASRAQTMRGLLEGKGLAPERFARISGHADRKPAAPDPTLDRNNRLEVILLRSVR